MANNKSKMKKASSNNAGGGVVYVMGLVGGLVYFVQAADGLWMVILGVLKAIVWPAYIVYKLLESFYG